MLPDAPEVAIVSSSDPTALAQGIEEQLRTESDAMAPAEDDAAPASVEMASFLVSREFYDLDRPTLPDSAPTGRESNARAAALLQAYSVTQMARETVAVYHELLDKKSGK